MHFGKWAAIACLTLWGAVSSPTAAFGQWDTPWDVEQMFRGVNDRAIADHGCKAAFPVFQHLNNQHAAKGFPTNEGMKLINVEVDFSKVNRSDYFAWMRHAHKGANDQGHLGGYPTGHLGTENGKTVMQCWAFTQEAAGFYELRDVAKRDLIALGVPAANLDSVAGRIRAIDTWSAQPNSGVAAAIPNGHMREDATNGLVFGVQLLKGDRALQLTKTVFLNGDSLPINRAIFPMQQSASRKAGEDVTADFTVRLSRDPNTGAGIAETTLKVKIIGFAGSGSGSGRFEVWDKAGNRLWGSETVSILGVGSKVPEGVNSRERSQAFDIPESVMKQAAKVAIFVNASETNGAPTPGQIGDLAEDLLKVAPYIIPLL